MGDARELRLREVSRHFRMAGQEVAALTDVTLVLRSGELGCIVGPSGSGKTTLINLIGGLDSPTRGNIEFGGVRVDQLSEAGLTRYRRTQVGFVFQAYNLIPNLTALENVELPLEFGRVARAPRRSRAARCLSAAELPADRWKHPAARLSGGEQQRVAIARALVADPPIILADEPTGNLDSSTGRTIRRLLGRLARDDGKIVVLVTHDLTLADGADQVFSIRDGRVSAIRP